MARWSDLSRARRAVELDKIGTTTDFVLLDLRSAAENLPALQDELERCKTDEERELLAFEWFEDHPQPTERSDWIGTEDGGPVVFSLDDLSPPTFRTPDWPGGRLPRLKDEKPAGERRGARELGIPEDELWWIVERRLENGERASRKWLATETRRREDLTYVPRDRLSPLVDWVDLHREAARHALSLRRIPAEFRAGKLGPIPPQV